LVIFGIVTVIVPEINHLRPSEDAQLLLGNYTNVLSALGASIAAGGGVMIHSKVKELHDKHEKLHNAIEKLHEKLEKFSGKKESE
jgi:hypothetical protein